MLKKNIIRQIASGKSSFWEAEREKNILNVFQKASASVPAYRLFLQKHNVRPENIKAGGDLHQIPVMDKQGYLRSYPLSELTPGGNFSKPLTFTSTSGSTGAPFYFHRSFDLDWQSSVIHELFYLHGRYAKDESVLVVVCFGMGLWIGGLITYQAFRQVQERGYNVSIITPGINKEEIFKALKNLGPLYKNIILAGYPPFIKDVIDEAPEHGVEWNVLRTRVIFAAENFSEDFRDYICRAIGCQNPLLDTMNIYGTADLGTMAFETPLSILIRRLSKKNQSLFKSLFRNVQKTPTLCQYIPQFAAFEGEGENILVTGDNTIPLVRYSLGDHGGTYSFNDLAKKCEEQGIDLRVEAGKAGIGGFCYELPFVYVYERDDFSVKLYGATIYPEHIKGVLFHDSLREQLTGKFTLAVTYDRQKNQRMEIHLELKNGQKPSLRLKKLIKKMISEELLAKNAEHANNMKSMPKRVEPRIKLWSHEDMLYFKPGIKQKWIKNKP